MFGLKKKLGFGCMRLPMNGDQIDTVQFAQMVDTYMANGFNYFDTAHGYINKLSEPAIKECLTSRYPRESYFLTDKLSGSFFNCKEDIRPFFEKQLEICGVDYFDFYLMHAQDGTSFERYKSCQAYETVMELKAEGKIRHMGISFHDGAKVLEKILQEYPQIEVVQLQFNYIDYDDLSIQSRECYDVCVKYGKPVLVMEPVKGGNLANLPDEAKAIFDAVNTGSYASYAIRFAAGFENVIMVLSGMGSMDMMNDNISYMKDFKPLTPEEQDAIIKVREVFGRQNSIQCTACRYCVDGCPAHIHIPEVFACMNAHKTFKDWNAAYYYRGIYSTKGGKASDCLGCGQCESACPQHLPIRKLLAEIAETFEKK